MRGFAATYTGNEGKVFPAETLVQIPHDEEKIAMVGVRER